MRYRVEARKGSKAYIQLYEQLRHDIITGIYPLDAKLPSKRLLSEESGVSVITVEHAYAILCDEGYVESRERSGYFVIYRQDDFLSHNEPPHAPHAPIDHRPPAKSAFPFSVLAKTMRKVLLDYGESILIKSPNRGAPKLREEISAYLGRSNGILARPEQIIVGAGSEYLYSLIVQLLGKERTFALEDPSYEKIRKVYEANGVVCERLTLGHNGIRSDELARSQATVLHVTPFNSYPSGISADVSKRNEYLQWAQARDAYIIEDNYDSELTVSKKNEDTVFSLSENDSVIYLNTFSKTIAPSIRVGYMVLPERLLERFEERLGFYSCTVPLFEQYVLAELLRSGDFERHVNRIRRMRRNALKQNPD